MTILQGKNVHLNNHTVYRVNVNVLYEENKYFPSVMSGILHNRSNNTTINVKNVTKTL